MVQNGFQVSTPSAFTASGFDVAYGDVASATAVAPDTAYCRRATTRRARVAQVQAGRQQQ